MQLSANRAGSCDCVRGKGIVIASAATLLPAVMPPGTRHLVLQVAGGVYICSSFDGCDAWQVVPISRITGAILSPLTTTFASVEEATEFILQSNDASVPEYQG